ncbi:MAG: MBOAT family protein [Lachnospiraceae bacterium]|nr:MBOAT family protein [Lachnospiraceae bacterium]
MVFSSMTFLWIFLPAVIVLGMIFRKPSVQNIILLMASLIFYAWGEPVYIILLLVSILMNWVLGMYMGKSSSQGARKAILALSVICNLSLLGYFKYAGLFTHTVERFLPSLGVKTVNISLPVGISFFTFQAMSYCIDLYRGEYEYQKDPLKLALYISFFPQLIAGPIVRYVDIEKALNDRKVTANGFASGMRRFIYGLSKKVLIANIVADVVDRVVVNPASSMGFVTSWFIAICYTLQIYYDFSGYSDMAIGLGRIFGFEFCENFDLPYLSSSISEFWRRWHISLGTWFREYLYIPLGGNKKGNVRTYINLFVVFAATGLWHGASWRFAFWGIYHGFFAVIERLGFSKFLKKHKIFAHIYTILVFTFGWVVFRADGLRYGLSWIKQMVIPSAGSLRLGVFAGPWHISALVLGLIGCGPLHVFCGYIRDKKKGPKFTGSICETVILGLLLIACIIRLSGNTYNPFIYFRF